MEFLVNRRLVFVTGKGGVGKSTVAIVLGLIAAKRGLRTIVAELAADARLQRVFDHAAGNGAGPERHYEEVELAPGLFTISVDPQHAMEEYLRLKTGPLGQALARARMFQAFAFATPGMRELLSIGKVWELAQLERRTEHAPRYDLVIVDAPATGHGIGILRTPRTFAEIARVGPISHQAGTIAHTIADRDFTSVIAVSTPEEMPVNETLALRAALERERLELDAVVVNAVYPERFSAEDAVQLEDALGQMEEPVSRSAIRAAISQRSRAACQAEQLGRLREAFPGIVTTLPYVFAPELAVSELERLADTLEAELT